MSSRLHNSLVFIFMEEYLLEKILMNGYSLMKPLNSSVVFIIVKPFILERNSMNATINVVKPLCYGIHWVPTQLKHQDNPNDIFFCRKPATYWSGPKKYTQNLKYWFFCFCLYFPASHVSNNFRESVFQFRDCLWVILVHYAYDHVIVTQM